MQKRYSSMPMRSAMLFLVCFADGDADGGVQQLAGFGVAGGGCVFLAQAFFGIGGFFAFQPRQNGIVGND